jgi:hypothetical protein
MGDRVVCVYGDSCLRESDVRILSGTAFINDAIMSFYFECVASLCMRLSLREVFMA